MAGSNAYQPQKAAVVIGATGLVGTLLVNQLINSSHYHTIYQFVRRAGSKSSNGKLRTIVVPDFSQLDAYLIGLDLNHADAFSALGTTLKQAGSRQAFRQVDFDYNLIFAQLVKKLGVQHFLLLSATGANPVSPIFYNRVKGELERAVEQLGFEHLSIFQPSLLIGQHQDQRVLENLAQAAFAYTRSWFPATWKYRPVEAGRVAKAMVLATHVPAPGKIVYSNTDILTLTLENPT
ncbi:hypothetical protein ACF3NA_05985 [Alkanindiges sp. WGS2144]|uniref:hypothetical protein n=1 Tax=Alkanindiges sp. WGS2144 TaxID=3366808 RepID=UPI003751EB94